MCWRQTSWLTITSPATPNASPSTATPPKASASATSPSGVSGASTSTTARSGARTSTKIYPDGIGAEEIFAYTYAVLHDPVYRYDYRVDLLREFPRLPLYHEFDIWARMGRELLDLHVGFESVEPYPLERVEKSHPAQPSSIREVAGPARYATQAQPAPVEGREPALSLPKGEGDPPKPRLRADKERGIITLDDQTSLAGVPPDAWRYRLGSRSALEWVLDQYKEKKPRDPTIRERFNTYRFADHKERVIDLLQRVCAVSVKTMEIVDDMAYWEDGLLIVFGDRDKHEWGMMGAGSDWFSEPNDLEMTIEEWEAMVGDVVLAPFPFTDLSEIKVRPAVVRRGRGDAGLGSLPNNQQMSPDARQVHTNPPGPTT